MTQKKTASEILGALVREGRARITRRLDRFTAHLRPEANHVDDPLVDILSRSLGSRTGKLRVSDAFLICGLEAGKVNQDQIARFARAIRELGWERARRRRNGVLEYAYVKGTAAEREVELIVEYDPHMRSVRIEINRGDQTPATN